MAELRIWKRIPMLSLAGEFKEIHIGDCHYHRARHPPCSICLDQTHSYSSMQFNTAKKGAVVWAVGKSVVSVFDNCLLEYNNASFGLSAAFVIDYSTLLMGG